MAKHILLNGAKYPMIGLGTWQSPPEQVVKAVESAIDCGYRHIDTAYAYQNESSIGEAVRKKIDEGVIKREDMFICTKLHVQFLSRAGVTEAIQKSLTALGLSYVDLYLIHGPIAVQRDEKTLWPIVNGKLQNAPVTDHVDTWKGMEDVYNAGLAKAIGLSNFNQRQIQRIYDSATVKPMNLQVECHAYFPQFELQEFCKDLGITFTAYAPIGSPGRMAGGSHFSKNDFPILLDDPKVKALADKYRKTPAQICLRWLTQRDIVAIPKSVTPERIKQNINIFDFSLNQGEMHTMSHLGVNVRTFTAEALGGFDHPEFPFEDIRAKNKPTNLYE